MERGCNREPNSARGECCVPRPDRGGGPCPSNVPLGRGLCWSPPQHPQCVPSACHQTEERCRRPGSPCPATAGGKHRLWVLSTLHPAPGSPKTPQQIPCLAIMIHFSRMKSAPLGSSQSPVVFGGSLQPSQAPSVLMQPVLEPGALTLSTSLHPQPFLAHALLPRSHSE